MSNSNQPKVFIIAGPNGAGKTTFAENFLPDFAQCYEFVNADLIAAGLSPFAPHTQDMQAARLFLNRVHGLASSGKSFSFETTLSGRSYAQLLKRIKNRNYRVFLFFLWLSDPDMAISRVQMRVSQGGHNVPRDIIIRRYYAGLKNLFNLYRPVIDVMSIYNATFLPPQLVAHEENGGITIFKPDIYTKISKECDNG
ncbi:zeta toxin family protein [Desulfonatronospira sp.]|uniref:zeta toxin family protein n=1 Tax=Desulfonatronospira sp. TaxID=1962951 RepID=UPI0025BA2414|nr:zeta toxin family protein [Desulfonatronospira sp.]